MANKRNKKTFKKDLLSQSYNDSIERIAGIKDGISFSIPPEILERRQKFWDQLFEKYMNQTSDGTRLNINSLANCKKEPVCKSSSVIQYWVNTGYLPYTKFRMDEDEQSDIGSLITVKCISLSPSSCNNSSSSSVDTAAYILSNMNTTNKAETMAIVEGAKDDISVISQNTESTKITEPAIDKILENSNENVILQKSLDANVSKDILSNTVDKLIDNDTLNYNKLMNGRLMCTFDDSIKRNSYIKQNLLNMKLSHAKETSLSKENFILHDSNTKFGRHKKLYTGRDSPVDVIEMNSNNKNIISKLKQNLHPALDFGCKLSKKYKLYKKRRRKGFSMPGRDLMNISQFNISNHNQRKRRKSMSTISDSIASLTDLNKSDDSFVTNNNVINNRVIEQHLVKRNIDQYMNRSLPIIESINKQDDITKLINHVDKIDIKKYKQSNEVTPKLKNLDPVVYLTRLSKDDIEKYKKSKLLTNKRRKLNTIQLSRPTMSTRKRRKLNTVTDKTNSNSTILFDKLNIQEYKKPNTMAMLNLNPIVRLKQLSEFEILKYKNSVNKKKNHEILNPRVLLNRLSKFDIKKYTNVNNNKVRSKSDILSRSIQIQDDNTESNDHSHFSTSNYTNTSLSVINLANEDTTSNQSTLLMRKCDSILFDNSSADNLSVFSKCSSQSYFTSTKVDNGNILKTKKRSNKKVKELDKVESRTDKHKLKVTTAKEYNTRILKGNSKNLNKSKNISLSPNETEAIYKNNSIHENNNKEELHTALLSDDDDEFVKLLHCSEDMQKLKLKRRYRKLYKDFNSSVEKSKEVRKDTEKHNNTNSSILLEQTFPKSIVEEKEEDPYPIKNKKFLQACNSTMEEDNENETRLLSNMNIISNKNRFRVNHLCYKTKIIESDSESLII